MNCERCKKYKKQDELTPVHSQKGNASGKTFELLCENCIRKVQHEHNDSGAGLEIESKDGKTTVYLTCAHCGLKTLDEKYYLEHNCQKFLNTKEFIKKGGLGDLK